MITNHEKQIMLKLYNKGYGPSQIGRAFGVDHSTVSYHLKNPNKPVVMRPNERKQKFKGYKEITEKPLWANRPKRNKIKIPQEVIYKKKYITNTQQEKVLKTYDRMLKEYNDKVFVRDEIGNLIKVGDKKKIEKCLKNCG